MQHDAWFFVGIFVFIFLVWAATGGPLHPIAFTGPRLAEPGELGGGTYLTFPRAPLSIGSSDVALPGSSSNPDLPSSGNSQSSAPAFTGSTGFGTPSPYRGLVSLNHYVSGAGSSDPKKEYVEIRVLQNSGVPIDITGWSVLSESRGTAVSIPKGTEVPTSGVVNAAQDIVLSPGDRAIVVTGSSPIGASFRENKCIGYFSTYQTFYPTLPKNCPVPSDELESYYGGGYIRDTACVNYVDTINRCQVTLTPPAGASSACQNFIITHLNYNGCVTAHQGDSDFKGKTWRVFLGRTSSFWSSSHEIVKLLDINGKTVDAFSY